MFFVGLKWLRLLLGRHKQLTIRTPENITMSSATVSELNIRTWFEKIHQYLKDNNLEHILNDPRRILNGDETAFLFDPVTKAVVASKGTRNVYLVQKADSKKNVTVLFTFDAEGYMFPPDAILPYKRLSKQILLSFDPDWGVGKSEKGWMDSENFIAYIQNILHPSLVDRNVPLPVIYFVDGHSSHTGVEAAELCADLGIILIALYPNATHIMQPADVAIFKPLKNSWGKCVEEWKMQNENKMFTIDHFGKVLREAISRGVSESIVRSGFRRCGLYPYDANAVDYTRCLATSYRTMNVSENTSNPTTLEQTVPIKLCNINEALRLVHATRIKSLVQFSDEEVSDKLEKALLYVYKTILSQYDSENSGIIDHGSDTLNVAVSGVEANEDNVAESDFEQGHRQRSDVYPVEQSENAHVIDDFVLNSSLQLSEIEEYAVELDEEGNRDIPACEQLGDSYEANPESQRYFSEEHNEMNETEAIVNATNKKNVLRETMNTEEPDRRMSISSFFNVPPTPKRKNVRRNYTQKRHFVLTSAERLKEIEEKEKEKKHQALQKEQNMKERSMKKELKEQEKQQRKKKREEKAKERKLNRQIKVNKPEHALK